MALTQEDIEQIQKLIKEEISHIPEPPNANVRYELDLRERTIRVEQELKHQRELMIKGFEQMEKRFELMQTEMEKRFEQIDKVFELMQNELEKRFEQVDKRFEQIDKRFEQVDKRFEQQHQEIMGLHQEIKQLIRWSFGTLLAIGGLIVAVLRITL
jgi:Flp pilus assembly protein TadB